MRIREILIESVDIRALIERVSKAIPEVLANLVEETLRTWRYGELYDYRQKHGLPKEWQNDPIETGFYPDDRIGDKISQLVTIEGFSPVYGAMTKLSRVLTQIVQQYVSEKFGDPIKIRHGNMMTIPVSDIRVSVWWHPKNDESYAGAFRSRSYHANGSDPGKNETLLEIVVDRSLWRDWLLDAFIGYLSGEGYIFDEFQENITNTLAHEYEHLEQNIKGSQNYTFSLLPRGKAGRNSTVDAIVGNLSPEDALVYQARPAEIDAMATGAAAQVIERIMRGFIHNWPGRTVQQMPDQQWNDAIRGELARGIYGIPTGELIRYVDDINDQLATADPVFKAKFLLRVKKRFLRTFYKRLTSYLRP